MRKRFFTTLMGLGLFPAFILAAPYFGEVVTMDQPDGSQVQVKLFGDEFYIRAESMDGYTVVRSPETGYIHYAELNEDGTDFTPSQEIYRGLALNPDLTDYAKHPFKELKLKPEARLTKIRRRQQDLFPNGEIYPHKPLAGLPQAAPAPDGKPAPREVLGMILLIDFPDDQATIDVEDINDYANMEGYDGYNLNGSVRDYFYEISNGQLIYNNLVSIYYRAQNNKDYYDRSDGYAGSQELIQEALEGIDASFDFSQLTLDSRDRVVAVNVMYAGSSGSTWGQGIWPHRGSVRTGETYDGVEVRGYQFTSIGSSLRLSTFVHENGHLLFGWPDLYDYDGDSRGMGAWCVMASSGSGSNPIPPNPYFRSLEGWDSLVSINDAPEGQVFYVQSNGDLHYSYTNPGNSRELFVISSVLEEGRSEGLPGEGLMILHIDRDGNNSDNEMTKDSHFYVSMEQADGDFDLENDNNRGDSEDPFFEGHATVFHDNTTPDANWWDGNNSGLYIGNISSIGEQMHFSIGDGDVTSVEAKPVSTGGISLFAGRGAIAVDLAMSANARAAVEIIDTKGRTVQSSQAAVNAGGRLHTTLDAGQLERGVYILRVRSDSREAHSWPFVWK